MARKPRAPRTTPPNCTKGTTCGRGCISAKKVCRIEQKDRSAAEIRDEAVLGSLIEESRAEEPSDRGNRGVRENEKSRAARPKQEFAHLLNTDLKKDEGGSEVSIDVIEKTSNFDREKSEAVFDAIDYYTAGGHEEIRENQKLGIPDPNADLITEYLNLAPVYDKGPIYRGLRFDKEDLEPFMEAIKNNRMNLEAISSFSVDKEVADDFSKGKEIRVVLVVKNNKSGVRVRNLSFFPKENEVLVPKGSKYKFVKSENAGNYYEIELEEI